MDNYIVLYTYIYIYIFSLSLSIYIYLHILDGIFAFATPPWPVTELQGGVEWRQRANDSHFLRVFRETAGRAVVF